MLTFSNRDLRPKVKDDLGSDSGEFDFLPFQDLDESVREDVEFLQATQLLNPGRAIRGFVYDVRTGGCGRCRSSWRGPPRRGSSRARGRGSRGGGGSAPSP
jgi:hypothetical protein